MIGTLSLLILEKEKDIQIIKALGGGELLIRKIFIGESLLLGLVGGIIGTLIALVFCFMQENFHLIPLQGAFVIDYYPVKMMGMDMVIVITTIILISIAAGIYPSYKASRKNFSLKAQ
jgi:lipoprotein-releasing system permease protein